ncbi:MAG: flavodoxin [Flavitalea sp.]
MYLSRTRNTKAVAEIIQNKTGGRLVELELQTPYPENYQAIVQQVARENESGFLPPLKTVINNFDKYDIVFLGFPTWGMQLPPPMNSFLNIYAMRGKTVVPFNTNGGYGVGSTFETVKTLSPGANVLNGYSTRGGLERDGQLLTIADARRAEVEREVVAWLNTLKLQ